jgi:hypothetical protein
MSKIIHAIIYILIFHNIAFNQEGPLNHSSLDIGIGGTNAVAPFAPNYWSNTVGLFHTHVGYRYMFNNKFGARLGLGFDRIKNDGFGSNGNSQEFRSQYFRSSLEIVLNMGRVLNFEDFAPKFSFLFHGGMGYSSNRNANAQLFSDFKNPNKDNMVNFIVGLTPQYKLNNKLSINVDVAFVNHIYQQRTWDLTQSHNSRGFDGLLANATVGVSYYIGENENHYDWKFDEKPPSKSDLIQEVYENIDAEELFKRLPDGDNDGVPDQLDGCPNESGLTKYNGCPKPKEVVLIDTIDNFSDSVSFDESKKNTMEHDTLQTDTVQSKDEELNSTDKRNTNKEGFEPVEVEAEMYEIFNHHELHIVVGMFKSNLNAENFVKQLRIKGYNANIVGISKGLRIVSIGSFDDVNKARISLEMAREEIIETAWMMKRLKTY